MASTSQRRGGRRGASILEVLIAITIILIVVALIATVLVKLRQVVKSLEKAERTTAVAPIVV